MTQSLEETAIRRLSTYCFETMWNGAPGEYTVNLTLTQLGQRPVRGAVMVGGCPHSLPDNDLYSVYAVPYRGFSNSELLSPGQWWSSDVVLAQKQTLLSVYDATGHVLPRTAVYLYHDRLSQMALVAIRTSVGLKLFSSGLPALTITAYRNPRLSTPIQSWGCTLPTPLTTLSVSAVQTQVAAYLAQSTIGTILVVNGVEVDPTLSSLTWTAGDCVDLLLDPSVIAAYDAEVGTLNTGYLSTLYAEARDVLHCPKASNPNLWILTHEAAYVSLWDQTTRRGVHIPRLDPHCIEQVTHADWSISRTVVTALKSTLGSTNVVAHVRVRQPANPHVLAATGSVLPALYECVDTEICEHLLGAIDRNATFWTAAACEQDPYAGLLFQTPQGTPDALLLTYRTALGYDQTANILGSMVQSHLPLGPSLILTKPYLVQHQTCYAMVFYQGRKLADVQVGQKNLPQGRLALSINPSLHLTAPNELSVTIVESAPFLAKTAMNTTSGVVTTIASPYVSIYMAVSLSTAITGWDGSSLGTGYVKLAPGADSYQVAPAIDGCGYTVTLSETLTNLSLLIIDDIYTQVLTTNLDTLLTTGAPLVVQLTGTDTDGNVVPLMNAATVDVYLNGYHLAPTLDYNLLPWTDPTTGAIGRIDVVVANLSYLALGQTGNMLEIIAHSSITLSQDVSYVLGQTLRHQVSPSFWNDGLSRCFIEGLLVDSVAWHTNWITVTSQPEGGVGWWSTMLHRRVQDLLQEDDPQQEYLRLGIVEKALNHVVPPVPSIIVQTSQHALYSPYLAAIISDVVSGAFTLVDDPDPRMFLQQFSRYAPLKAVDPSLSTYTGPVNTSYVAIGATYLNSYVLSGETEALVQRLISYTINPTITTLGEMLI